MSLFSFFQKKSTKVSTKYFGIYLKPSSCILAILSDGGTHIEIQEQYLIEFSDGWTKMAEDLDQRISMLDPELSTIEDVIFFIPSTAIDQENKKLKSPYLENIKVTVKKLGFKPLGFIGADEAVMAAFHKKEAIPPSALLVEITHTELSLFVYKAGNCAFTRVQQRGEDIFTDFEAILEELKGTMMLPARIIVFGDNGLEHFYQRVLHYKWSEEIFIQLPRVEIMAEKDLLTAFTQVFSQQIYAESASVEKSAEESLVETSEEVAPEVMGFHIGTDAPPIIQEAQPEISDAEVVAISPTQKKKFSLPPLFSKLKGIGGIFTSISSKIPKKRFLLPLILIFLIGILLAVQEVFFHTAVITVFLPSKEIQKKYELALDIENPSGPLQIQIATQSAEFTEAKAVSGKKDIGERAKGKVTIHNFDEKEKVFNRGSILSNSNLKFTLDEDIKVASASLATDGSAKLPGKVQATITASVIGTESNLDKGQRFSFEGLSSSVFFAINDGGAISGGTKKTVAVVSQQDITQLRSAILKKAQTGQSNRPAQLQPSDKLITELTNVSIEKSTASEAVGDEAEKVSLKASVITTYYFLQDDEVKAFVATNMQNEVESNFTLDPEKIIYSFDTVEKSKDEESITLAIDATGKANMQTDKAAIEKVLSGKSKTSLDSTLRDSFKATGYEIDNKLLIPLPLLQNYTPFMQKNIILNISYL